MYRPFSLLLAALLTVLAAFCATPCAAQTALPAAKAVQGSSAGVPRPFSFLLGSCAFFDTAFDKRTDDKFRIYESMLHTPSDFMLWSGDAVYYIYEDWKSPRAMRDRWKLYRSQLPYLKEFLASRPQYAVWDDHDYGPDNSDSRQPLKDTAKVIFRDNFPDNPPMGNDTIKGVTFSFSHEDSDFFMMDDRYYCNEKQQTMWGRTQLNWLKYKLLHSTARFKFIINGIQYLHKDRFGESFRYYPREYDEFQKFLLDNQIKGVILLSGDRHQSELSKLERKGTYPLYDFTCSGLTSIPLPVVMHNRYRVKGSVYRKHNYARITVSGTGDDRTVSLEVLSRYGKQMWQYNLRSSELGYGLSKNETLYPFKHRRQPNPLWHYMKAGLHKIVGKKEDI